MRMIDPFARLIAILSLSVLLAAVVAGCGGDGGDDVPVPTLARLDALATERAADTPSAPTQPPTSVPPTATATSEPPTATSTDAPPTATPTVPASPSPTATVPADSPTDTPAVTPSPTLDAGILAFTQTAVAVQQATQTAQAQITATFTPAPLPDEPFQIVFYSNRHGSDDLYLMTLNGVEWRLTGSAANEREPSCLPDGRSVVYASDESGRFQIYRLDFDNPVPVQLTDSAGMNFAPAVSPDGSQIAFVSTRADGIPTIWIMNADGTNQHQVTTELGRDTAPSWGPDGRQLLYSSEQFGPWNLFLTVIGENIEGEFPVLPPEFGEVNQLWPVFDPTGERIAYTVWDDLSDPQTADIMLLDFEQPEPVVIRDSAFADIAWDWGDDTHLIASVGGPKDVQIALVDITTGETVRLTQQGPFNGGARLCTVQPDVVPPEPPLAPSPTPTPFPTATPPPTPQAAVIPEPLADAAGAKHIVQPGDTLMHIGYRYGVNWMALAWINELSNPDVLSVGQTITVPVTRPGRSVRGGYQPVNPDEMPRDRVRKEIVVELSKQVVKAYEDGRLVRMVTVSTGLPDTPTVTGEFSIYHKNPAQTMSGPGYYLPDVPWVMYFYQGYGLHGTYWHNNFGRPMSHGCVNLPTAEAKWFYDWAEIGTPVLVKQ